MLTVFLTLNVQNINRFYGVRWCEDEPVAERGLLIWNSVVKVMKYWEPLPKTKKPDCKSYVNLLNHVSDRLMPAKMQFFRDIAKTLNSFLKRFQTNRPMVPFLSGALVQVMKSLLRIFIKEDVIREASSALKVSRIDVENEENYLDLSKIKVSTALKEILREVDVPDHKKMKFKSECRSIIISIILKLKERSPLNYTIVRAASSLDPEQMANSKEIANAYFGALAGKLARTKLILSDEADDAMKEYEKFLGEECIQFKDKFEAFNQDEDRLDEFLGLFYEEKSSTKASGKFAS